MPVGEGAGQARGDLCAPDGLRRHTKRRSSGPRYRTGRNGTASVWQGLSEDVQDSARWSGPARSAPDARRRCRLKAGRRTTGRGADQDPWFRYRSQRRAKRQALGKIVLVQVNSHADSAKAKGWALRTAPGKWCPEEDSNLHALQRWYLKPVRLPIPPSGHASVGRCLFGVVGGVNSPEGEGAEICRGDSMAFCLAGAGVKAMEGQAFARARRGFHA